MAQQILIDKMQNKRDRATFLRQLYERKFYQQNQAKGLVEKVISFQKKIEDFKVNRNHPFRMKQEQTTLLLEAESKKFRPMTNYACNRYKRLKIQPESFSPHAMDGPATAELRLILSNKNEGELKILTESIKEKNFYSIHQHRKKMKILSQRNSINDEPNSDAKSRLTPIDMSRFYHEGTQIHSQKKVRQLNYQTKQEQRNYDSDRIEGKPMILSKKVMIGGRDLQKAAEEYYKHFKEVNRNLQLYQLQQRREQIKQRTIKSSTQRKRIRSISSKKSSRASYLQSAPLKKQKVDKKAEEINQKKEDFLNKQLNPWKVESEIFC